MTAKTAIVRDVAIHYEDLGVGRPVVLLHGLSGEHRLMIQTFEPIFTARPGGGPSGGSGWRRIYPDMPGHGATPAPDWLETDDDVLAVLIDFVDAVTGGQRLVVAGLSWGGYLAYGLANKRADRIDGMMLTVPVVHGDRGRRDLPPQMAVVADPAAVAAVRPDEEIWLAASTVQTQEQLDRFRARPTIVPPDEAFLERLVPRYAYSFEDELTMLIEAPALIVAGRQDAITGYRDAWPLLEHLPRATYAVLDRAAHALAYEQSDLLAALTSDWLDRVEEYIEVRRTALR